jgi:predicted Zn-dependent peptidase
MPPSFHRGSATRVLDRFNQQAVLLAHPSASASDPLDETAEAVAAILGGVNSRIYWNVVQEGLSPRAGAFREEFHDVGAVMLFALCEPENAEGCLDAMREEARKFAEAGVEPKEIARVKNLRRTSLAVESEAPFYRLGQLADDVDYLGGPRTAEERLAAVDAVSEDSIAACLERFPITGEGLLVSVGPREWPD